MTYLLCSDRSVNAGMNLEKKCYKPSIVMKVSFFFLLSRHIKKMVTSQAKKLPLGIPFTVTIKKNKNLNCEGTLAIFYSFILTSTGCKYWQQETPDCDTHFSVQEILRQ